MTKTLLKILKWVGLGLGGLIAFAGMCMLVFWMVQPLFYGDYYEEAKEEFAIVGLGDGVVPQGFCALDDDTYAYCGYMADGISASRIYVIKDDGETGRYIELYTADGKPYTGHTGGLTISDTTAWLANDGEGDDNCVWAFSATDLLDESIKRITLENKFYPESRASCCFADESILWVGEFYDPEKYPTKDSHHLTSPDGAHNPSFICGYTIDPASPTGIAGNLPVKILSAPEKLQGFAINENGQWVLSSSYGLSSSNLQFYDNVLAKEHDTTYTMDGQEIPVWFLDNKCRIKTVGLPPMSEELVYKDGRVYILYESACRKYLFGILTRGRYVYSYPF